MKEELINLCERFMRDIPRFEEKLFKTVPNKYSAIRGGGTSEYLETIQTLLKRLQNPNLTDEELSEIKATIEEINSELDKIAQIHIYKLDPKDIATEEQKETEDVIEINVEQPPVDLDVAEEMASGTSVPEENVVPDAINDETQNVNISEDTMGLDATAEIKQDTTSSNEEINFEEKEMDELIRSLESNTLETSYPTGNVLSEDRIQQALNEFAAPQLDQVAEAIVPETQEIPEVQTEQQIEQTVDTVPETSMAFTADNSEDQNYSTAFTPVDQVFSQPTSEKLDQDAINDFFKDFGVPTNSQEETIGGGFRL